MDNKVERTPLTIAPKSIKYLEKNFTKHLQVVHIENYRNLQREVKETLEKQFCRNLPASAKQSGVLRTHRAQHCDADASLFFLSCSQLLLKTCRFSTHLKFSFYHLNETH
jgi:hypothetical protein